MNRSQKTRVKQICVLAAAILFMIPATQADVLTFGLSYEFSGATSPAGSTPWLTATLNDHGGTGSVDLLLETTNLTDNEFVFLWLFNLDPTLDPTALSFSAPTKTGLFTDPDIYADPDAYKADGDGDFDIKIEFDNSDGAPTRFGVDDAVQYTITGIPELTVDSFDFLSVEGGGQGSFPTAAHVGGIGENSGWISIPEPNSMVLIGMASSMIAFVRSRFLI